MAAPTMAMATRYINPRGEQVDSPEAVTAAAVGQAKATVELRLGTVSFVIELVVDPNTHPFVITGGKIVSGICGAPWEVNSGNMGDDLLIKATRTGSGSCADTITILGQHIFPSAWQGTYGFNGQSSMFTHTTLFRGWTAP